MRHVLHITTQHHDEHGRHAQLRPEQPTNFRLLLRCERPDLASDLELHHMTICSFRTRVKFDPAGDDCLIEIKTSFSVTIYAKINQMTIHSLNDLTVRDLSFFLNVITACYFFVQ
jgi:hypothetical protein